MDRVSKRKESIKILRSASHPENSRTQDTLRPGITAAQAHPIQGTKHVGGIPYIIGNIQVIAMNDISNHVRRYFQSDIFDCCDCLFIAMAVLALTCS